MSDKDELGLALSRLTQQRMDWIKKHESNDCFTVGDEYRKKHLFVCGKCSCVVSKPSVHNVACIKRFPNHPEGA